jgi:hypothetical protein
VLVVRAGDQTPKAVPLALVTRLEESPAKAIERVSAAPWCSTAAS